MSKDALIVGIGILLVNGLGEYYGLSAWSPFRLIPNLVIFVYAMFRYSKGGDNKY